MAIADKLTELQATKTAIKTAIENKGQDLSGVPFTEYASKIDAIQGGEAERSIKKYLEAGGTFARQSMEDFRPLLEYSDTENIKDCPYMFQLCTKLKYVPMLDLGKMTRTYYFFSGCTALVEEGLPLWDTKNVGDFQGMFTNCTSLKAIPAYDMRNAWNIGSNMLVGCTALEEIRVKNIPVNLSVGSGTSWGHLLTQESALSLCKECVKPTNVNLRRTITFATPVYDNLETLYVKLVTITDEMRAEDDLIDSKLPFEVCASTDDGAMTIASYMALKNWSIAK